MNYNGFPYTFQNINAECKSPLSNTGAIRITYSMVSFPSGLIKKVS